MKESLVEDYGVNWLKARGKWDPNAEWAANAYNLTVDDHVNTMKVLAKYLDSAMSKTVNLPADYPYEDFKKLYVDCWKTGTIKGCTTYREGTMTSVLSKVEKVEETQTGFEYRDAPKRPKALDCELFNITAKGKQWVVIVGLYDEKPYEVFALPHNTAGISDKIKKGVLRKDGRGDYTLISEGQSFTGVTKSMSDEEESLTRMISTALRHGSDINFIVEQLDKSHGTVVSFNKAIARVLKKYAKKIQAREAKIERLCDTGDCKIVHEDGCIKCLTCGQSACK